MTTENEINQRIFDDEEYLKMIEKDFAEAEPANDDLMQKRVHNRLNASIAAEASGTQKISAPSSAPKKRSTFPIWAAGGAAAAAAVLLATIVSTNIMNKSDPITPEDWSKAGLGGDLNPKPAPESGMIHVERKDGGQEIQVAFGENPPAAFAVVVKSDEPTVLWQGLRSDWKSLGISQLPQNPLCLITAKSIDELNGILAVASELKQIPSDAVCAQP